MKLKTSSLMNVARFCSKQLKNSSKFRFNPLTMTSSVLRKQISFEKLKLHYSKRIKSVSKMFALGRLSLYQVKSNRSSAKYYRVDLKGLSKHVVICLKRKVRQVLLKRPSKIGKRISSFKEMLPEANLA